MGAILLYPLYVIMGRIEKRWPWARRPAYFKYTPKTYADRGC